MSKKENNKKKEEYAICISFPRSKQEEIVKILEGMDSVTRIGINIAGENDKKTDWGYIGIDGEILRISADIKELEYVEVTYC